MMAFDRVAFYGTFLLLGFAPLAFGGVEPWAIFVLESATAALFSLWLISQARASELHVAHNPLFIPMAAFGVLVVAQIVLRITIYRDQTVHQGMLYCAYGLLCFLGVQCLRRTSQVYLLAFSASAYGFALAIFAIFQSVSSNGKLYWLRSPSAGGWIFGPYVNHNHYAGLMEMLIPIPLVAALSDMIRRERKVWALGAAAVMASTIFLSGSRGGMVAFAAQLVILGTFLIGRKRRRAPVWALAGFALVAVGLMVWLGGSQLGERIVSIRGETSTEISGGTRIAILGDSLRMFTARPWLGWGLGTFADAYPQFRSFYTNLFVNQAHNDYAQLLVEMGVLGFTVMLWFLITAGYHAQKKLKHWSSNVNGAVTLAAMLGCVGILVHSLVDFNLQIPANAAWFYFLCALATMEPRFPLLHHRPVFRQKATESEPVI